MHAEWQGEAQYGLMRIQNESVRYEWLNEHAAEEVRQERQRRQKAEEKGRKKNEEDMKRANEKRKKKFVKQYNKNDKQNEKIARELVDSVDEKHLLSFSPFGLFMNCGRLLSLMYIDIALQICLLDSKMFYCIPRQEFIKQKWAKAEPEKFAPNITQCIENFNNVGLSSVLVKY